MPKAPVPTKIPTLRNQGYSKRQGLFHNIYFYGISFSLIVAGFLLVIFFYHQGLNTGHTKFELEKAMFYNENEARKDTIRYIRDSLKLLQVQYAELYKIDQGIPSEKLDSLRFLISLNDSLSMTKKKLAEAKQTIQQLQKPMNTSSETVMDARQKNELALGRIALSKIFSGSWSVTYLDSIAPNTRKPYQLSFDLLTSGRYLEKDLHTSNLEGIEISDDQKTIRFTKVPVSRQDKSIEVELVRQSYGLYRGTENGRRVDYKKQRD